MYNNQIEHMACKDNTVRIIEQPTTRAGSKNKIFLLFRTRDGITSFVSSRELYAVTEMVEHRGPNIYKNIYHIVFTANDFK